MLMNSTQEAMKGSQSIPKSSSNTKVNTAETKIDPRQPRRFEKNKNMVPSIG